MPSAGTEFPIYGSPFTVGMVRNRLDEAGRPRSHRSRIQVSGQRPVVTIGVVRLRVPPGDPFGAERV